MGRNSEVFFQMKTKTRIRYKNILFNYHLKNLIQVITLAEVKAFFSNLFTHKLTTNQVRYLLVSQKTNNQITVFLQLINNPDFRSSKNFRLKSQIIPQVENVLSPIDLVENLQNYPHLFEGNPDFVIDVSKLPRPEQYDRFMSFFRALREEKERQEKEKNSEQLITLEKAILKTYKYLRETKNYLEFQNDQINKLLKSWFDQDKASKIITRVECLNSFRINENSLVGKQLTTIKLLILKLLQQIYNNPNFRPPFINGEGPSGIGKTQFFITLLTYLGIPFNHIKGPLNFTKFFYNDEAYIDIYDDSEYDRWQANHEKIAYAKAIIGANLKGQMTNTQKYDYQIKRTLQKNKLPIIICNSGKASFRSWVLKDKFGLRQYIEERNGYFFEFTKEKLYYSAPEENLTINLSSENYHLQELLTFALALNKEKNPHD
jgi:hypothetical protein